MWSLWYQFTAQKTWSIVSLLLPLSHSGSALELFLVWLVPGPCRAGCCLSGLEAASWGGCVKSWPFLQSPESLLSFSLPSQLNLKSGPSFKSLAFGLLRAMVIPFLHHMLLCGPHECAQRKNILQSGHRTLLSPLAPPEICILWVHHKPYTFLCAWKCSVAVFRSHAMHSLG